MPLNPPTAAAPGWPRLSRRPGAYPPVGPPPPAEIPICWLTTPLSLRLDQPYTTAEITRAAGGGGRNAHVANRDEYGDFGFSATLNTACSADPANLAHWTITYRSTPRMRSPELAIDLFARTDEEKLRILRMARWSRLVLTGVPPEFPEGASSLILVGRRRLIGVRDNKVFLTTASVIGSTPGVPGPWFRFGSSAWGGTHAIPF